MSGDSLVNTDELESALMRAEIRVLKIQTKLHRWAGEDPHRRFDDLFNLVADPAFLLVAWDRVRGNKGARTAGVDGQTAVSIQVGLGVEEFLDGLRTSLKDRSFRPLPERVRQRIGDKRVLALVKAFLKAGILGEDGLLRDSRTGAPQGSILSPLLSNVALSVLDEYIAQIPGGPRSNTVERAKRKRHGLANYRLI